MTLANAMSFKQVRERVHARADQMLPDQVVHLSDLRMNAAGHFTAPAMPEAWLNDWARKQLASLLGFRDRWFASSSPEERADEISRRLSRMPGERKLRFWRDETGNAEGIVRAIVGPSFTAIDDVRIFDRIKETLGTRGLDEYLFVRVDETESSTQYSAVHADPIALVDDPTHPGFTLRNSEVGGAALTLDDYLMRLACSNGLLLRVGGKRLLYRTHRSIEDDALAAALVVALSKLPDRAREATELLSRARTIEVPHPDTAVATVLEEQSIPRALVEEAQKVALTDGDRTKYGVVQAITYVAHATNRDPDVRFAMERLAGEYLTAF